MVNWETCGFFKAFSPTKNKTKEPMLPYTKAENQWKLDQCSTYNGFLGLLADTAVMLDADEDVHSNNLLKIIEGEQLLGMVTQRSGGRGIHALFHDSSNMITQCHTILLQAYP